MTSYAEAAAFHAAAEANFDAACAIYKRAAANMKRSKSRKNVEAFAVAQENHEAAAEVCRKAQDRMERAATAEARLAAVAPRRATKAAQGNLL